MNTSIRKLTQEAHEIICNINAAARNMEITAQQRDELIALVMTDVREKISRKLVAAEMLYYWTGAKTDDEYPLVT